MSFVPVPTAEDACKAPNQFTIRDTTTISVTLARAIAKATAKAPATIRDVYPYEMDSVVYFSLAKIVKTKTRIIVMYKYPYNKRAWFKLTSYNKDGRTVYDLVTTIPFGSATELHDIAITDVDFGHVPTRDTCIEAFRSVYFTSDEAFAALRDA